MRARRTISFVMIGGAILAGGFLVVAAVAGVGEVRWSSALVLPSGIALAWILTARAPENRMSLLMSLIIFTGTLLDVQVVVADWAIQEGRTMLLVASTQLGSAVWLLFFIGLFVLLPLWFPTGKAISPSWEWVWRLAAVGVGLAFGGTVLSEATCIDQENSETCGVYAANPWGIDGVHDTWFNPLFIVAMMMAIPAVASLVIRYRRARGEERQQLRWLSASSSLLLIVWLFSLEAVQHLIGFEEGPWFRSIVDLAALAVLTSIAIAVLRYRLYDIDRIISRTVSYVLVVGLLGLVFAAGVVWIPNLIPGIENSALLVAGSTLAVAALFNPIRKRVQGLVDRRFNRSHYDVERVMDRFAGTLRDRVDPDGVVDGWVGVVSETMQPEAVSVWVRD